MELPNADGASTAQEVDSLKQAVHNRDEELTSPLEARVELVVRGGEGEVGGEGVSGEKVEDYDLWASAVKQEWPKATLACLYRRIRNTCP